MPDHIHLFVAPGDMRVSLDDWLRYWKRQFSRQHQNSEHHWQTDYWDTRLRRSENYAEKWDYVRHNPVRQGLVEHSDDWPYQGEIHVLSW